MITKLYVGNLAYETTEAELRRLFARAGNVLSVELIKDHANGQSKGFAFVGMNTAAEAQAAIDMFKSYPLAGRELTVSFSRKRELQSNYRSHLSAFGLGSDKGLKATSRQSEPARGGYQSRYSAFGDQNNSNRPRRRGGNQRH